MAGEKASGTRLADKRVIRLFAIGQLGWAILSGIVSNWLVYFYMPSDTMLSRGMAVFITQGAVFAGLTVIGIITGCGRLLDGFVDPFIASQSDRLNSPLGRRIPFMRGAAIPFGVMTVLVFVLPGTGSETLNNVLLFCCLMLFYITLSLYCTPFNALEPAMGIAGAFRITVAVLAAVAVACMLVPAFGIDETLYAKAEPSSTPMFQSVAKTFKNHDFQVFELSDVLYWVAITMFQTGMTYYITELMGLPDSLSFVFFAAMTLISLLFYAPVNMLAKRHGKKRIVAFGFFFFCAAFAVTSVCGMFGIPGMVWGMLVAVLAAVPMAILGILPQAVLADIAECDALETGERREGMFYAARTFSMTLGQTLAMILFTSISILGENGMGYRATAIVATAFCLIGGLVFTRYNERRVLGTIGGASGEAKGGDRA